MTTVKEVLDKFNAGHRYSETFENINIGDYTFDKAYIDISGFVAEFVNTDNPDVWLTINEDNSSILLVEKINEDSVNVTSWNRHGKMNKHLPSKKFRKIPKSRQKPIPTKSK